VGVLSSDTPARLPNVHSVNGWLAVWLADGLAVVAWVIGHSVAVVACSGR